MIHHYKTVEAAAKIAREFDEAHAQIGRAIAKKIMEELYPSTSERAFQYARAVKDDFAKWLKGPFR